MQRRSLTVLCAGIALAAIGLGAPAYTAPVPQTAETFLAANAHVAGVTQTASGLQYKVLTPGNGPKPTDDDVALVNYVGSLTDGTVFDQSPQPMPLPVAEMVPGFTEALKLMPKGAKYRFWIPPALGYGDQASGPIPAHSVLVFNVELLDWKSTAEFQMMQQQMQQANPGAAPDGASQVQ
jgi:FKBP-type peptidyl-prolyl cis-trans isomerase FkpA